MGPLSGIKVLEFEAIGPGPFAGMLLADMGADVLVVDRPAAGDLGLKRERWYDVLMRGKRSVTLDLKADSGKEAALQLIGRAEALIEGFRPGVMERLGLGPHESLEKNPRLVYGRMTGWGQSGPLAPRAGHDINYIALAGVLHAFGRKGEAPVPPLNLVGDFGGGGMLLGFGIACPLLDRASWPKMREQFAKTFKTKTRDEWCRVFEGSDACFAPVLSWSEARRHPQSMSRNSYVTVAGVEQPAPAPRFSRTPAKLRGAPPERGEGGAQALADWGFDNDEVKRLRSLGLGIKE